MESSAECHPCWSDICSRCLSWWGGRRIVSSSGTEASHLSPDNVDCNERHLFLLYSLFFSRKRIGREKERKRNKAGIDWFESTNSSWLLSQTERQRKPYLVRCGQRILKLARKFQVFHAETWSRNCFDINLRKTVALLAHWARHLQSPTRNGR